MDKWIENIKDLFAQGEVTLVIGYEAGTDGDPRPFFCRSAQQADRLVFPEGFAPNLAVYLTKQELVKGEKVAVIATVPTLRSICYLQGENQLGSLLLAVYHLTQEGEWRQFATPEQIAQYIDAIPLSLSEKDRALVEKLDAMTPEERWAFWQNEFSRCIKCYACRAACPMCYCTRCIVEDNRPQWIDPWPSPLSNMEWQISRVMHLAGRCVGCGSCGEACPEHIPVHLLNRRLSQDIQADFGVVPGAAPKQGAVLNTFRVEDKENFIV